MTALVAALAAACGGSALPAPPDAAPPDAAPPDARRFPDAAPPVACGPGVDDDVACPTQGELCAIEGGCCVCGGLFGICSLVWVCSVPAENDPSCPPAPPAWLGDCTVADGVVCSYCEEGAPYQSYCTTAAIWLECEQAGHERCWLTTPKGANCD